jgi:hypothetical protein
MASAFFRRFPISLPHKPGGGHEFREEAPMATDRKIFAIALIGFLAFAPSAYASVAEGLMTYCKADAQRLCAGIAPGGGRIIKCLKAHQNEMTVGCAKALMKLKSKMGG